MRDADVRVLLMTHLHEVHRGESDTRFIDELDVCNGAARIDVAVINGKLTGWEIKSPRDTLDRLPGQVDYYSRVCDEAWLVTDAKHLGSARALIPPWWGLMLIEDDDESQVRLEVERTPQSNPQPSPDATVRLLWRREVLAILSDVGHDVSEMQRATRAVLWSRLIEVMDPGELRSVVRRTLKEREQWRRPGARRTARRDVRWELVATLEVAD